MECEVRKELEQIFRRWEAAEITCQAVQRWALRTSAKQADVCVAEILTHLRALGEFLITTDDLPRYREVLEMPPEDGLFVLKKTGAGFDVKQRATDLQRDPFYGPHTKAILKDLA